MLVEMNGGINAPVTMVGGKVKLPKEVAEAIKRFKEKYGSETAFRVEAYVGTETAQGDAHEIVLWMRKGNHRKYYTALVNGYEVEQSPEDKVRELYEHWDMWPGANNCFSSDTIASVIIDVVNTLGHKIEGVNA